MKNMFKKAIEAASMIKKDKEKSLAILYAKVRSGCMESLKNER
jgi:hypothetical protein